MKSLTGISLLAASALLVACNGGDDKESPPTGPPAPMSLDFNSYVTTMATSTVRDADQAIDVDALMFTFKNDDEAAFSMLFP